MYKIHANSGGKLIMRLNLWRNQVLLQNQMFVRAFIQGLRTKQLRILWKISVSLPSGTQPRFSITGNGQYSLQGASLNSRIQIWGKIE